MVVCCGLPSCVAVTLSGLPPALPRRELSLARRSAGARRSLGALGLSPEAAQADAGERLFAANYAGCHAGGGNVVKAERTLEKKAIEKYLTGGFSVGHRKVSDGGHLVYIYIGHIYIYIGPKRLSRTVADLVYGRPLVV